MWQHRNQCVLLAILSALFVGYLLIFSRNAQLSWNESASYTTNFVPKLSPTYWNYKSMPQSMLSYRNGSQFVIPGDIMGRMGLPIKEFVNLTGDFLQEFVFVTAASANHYSQSIDAVASVQKYFPGRKIYYYDLGVDAKQLNELTGKNAPCDVEYRYFDFKLFPPHVGRHLSHCAWKWLIVQEVFRSHPGVLWFDASIRFKSNDVRLYREKLVKNGGAVIFSKAGHSNVAVTHPLMYRYLPTDAIKQQRVMQWQAGGILIYNTWEVYWNVLHWAYLCALTEGCISPVNALACHFSADKFHVFANCHRYDQAMINLLLSTWHNYTAETYTAGSLAEELFIVERFVTHHHEIKLCQNHT